MTGPRTYFGATTKPSHQPHRKPRPYCARCAAGDHKATTHNELGCLYEMASGRICDCDHGATIDFRAPLDDGQRVEICINPRTAVARKGRAA